MKSFKKVIAIVLALVMIITIAPSMTKVKASSVTIISVPQITGVTASSDFLNKTVTVNFTGYGIYRVDDETDTHTVKDITVKLFKNDKLIGTVKDAKEKAVFKNVMFEYAKTTKIKVALYLTIMGKEIEVYPRNYTLTTKRIGKIKTYATKISKNKVALKWDKMSNVSGYYVYMGKKKVKTLKPKKKMVTITKKKAGKSKFSVIPFVKLKGKIYKGSSNKAKPKKNQAKSNYSLDVKSRTYATCDFIVKKISLKGKTYTVTGYALNNRMFKAKKYNKLKLKLRVDGKIVFNKTIKNKRINVKKYGKKKLTFKIKGKAGSDLVYGKPFITVKQDTDWGIKNDSFKD